MSFFQEIPRLALLLSTVECKLQEIVCIAEKYE